MESIDPTTGASLRRVEPHDLPQSIEIVERAHAAFRAWRRRPVEQRAELVRAVATQLRGRSEALAERMACEMGKPLAEGRAEVEKCAWGCEYFAENAARFLAPEVIETAASKSYVTYEPLGVVLAIMPWNFPLWQVLRFAAPAWMAGNTTVVKHAPNVPGCALALEELVRDAGFPDGCLLNAFVDVEHVPALLGRDEIAAVTLTGSTRAGRAVAEAAGARLKKVVLELGGSDAYVVLEDADLAPTVEACATARLINAGQSCIAAKRFVVVDAVRDEFTERLVERMRAVRVGSPLEDGTDVGPLARVDLRDELHRQVTASVEAGARLLLGGERPEGPGAFYPPTVLADVAPGMPAFDEELFGPAASIVPARDEADAIRLANATRYGLGAAVFTRDVARGERIAARELEAGNCFVNDFVRSDPRLPFGGIRDSGYGRELAAHGIREFVNAKTVYVA